MFPTILASDEQKTFAAPGTNARAVTLTKVKAFTQPPRPHRYPRPRIIVSAFRFPSIPCPHRDRHRRKIRVSSWRTQSWSKSIRII